LNAQEIGDSLHLAAKRQGERRGSGEWDLHGCLLWFVVI
jgi:hypothetical protein